ncbi:hypothetical protein SHELI_v1c02210 [Spiroplasma helicoides]|uniref:DUF3137 domain-containing protein n=1 Tax=Spiroplasma helicoides TaxID=216938 RepID=A0A1B3SJR6_9MOLU|nr:hypothetical protein [Spiroplasma helicoides]AOG60176.1 hypothetical protein SHELI_v1c02210 [Spiroplasma helicoides]
MYKLIQDEIIDKDEKIAFAKNLFSEAIENNKNIKQKAKSLMLFQLIFVLVISFGIGSISFAMMFYLCTMFDYFQLTTIKPIYISLTFLILGFALLIVALGMNFYNNDMGKEANFFEAFDKTVGWENVYKKYFDKYLANKDFMDFTLNLVKDFKEPISVSYSEYQRSIKFNSDIYYIDNVNSLNFIYKGSRVSFVIDTPVYARKSKNSMVFGTKWLVFGECKKFDNSYNGVVISKHSIGSESYKSESVEFNEHFYINLKSTDLRAPKFLNPKYVDSLIKLDYKKIGIIGYKNGIYAENVYTTNNYAKCIMGVASMFKKRVFSIKKIKLLLAQKLVEDFAIFLQSFNFIKENL